MAGLTTEAQQQVLAGLLAASGDDIYLALYTTPTGDDASGTEVTGGSYSRQSITFDTPVDGVAASDADVTFLDMPAAYVTHVALWIDDGVDPAWMFMHGALAAPISLDAADDLTFDAGDLIIEID